MGVREKTRLNMKERTVVVTDSFQDLKALFEQFKKIDEVVEDETNIQKDATPDVLDSCV